MTLGGSVVQHSHSLVHVVIGAFSQPGKYKVIIARTKSGADMPLTSPPAKGQKGTSHSILHMLARFAPSSPTFWYKSLLLPTSSILSLAVAKSGLSRHHFHSLTYLLAGRNFSDVGSSAGGAHIQGNRGGRNHTLVEGVSICDTATL